MAEWINRCPNGHSSPGGDGQCVTVGCAHMDQIVTKPTRRKGGLSMGSPAEHGVDRHIRRRRK